MQSTAISHPNKAIVIYWGNEDVELNTPTRTSLSMTLVGVSRKLDYTVSLKTEKNLERDKVIVDGKEDKGEIFDHFVRHLDSMRAYTRFKEKLLVTTSKTFPVGSGLAGSAAAASATAEAFAGLIRGGLDRKKISIMARRGSGSAARSVLGGFVKLQRGSDAQSTAVQLWDEKHWDLRDIIVVVDAGQKKVKSRVGMALSTRTCPEKLYAQFVAIADPHVKAAGKAIASKSLQTLGSIYEEDNLFFRRVCMNTVPSLDYWSQATHDVFREVEELRQDSVPVFAGTDAGPNVHVLVEPKNLRKVVGA
ncbi:MAG TPA: diphosphomevalonate decarboxylase, partial [Nitrososphaera sp.]|nr:diphosphomevalonate decarboxylase [Nitrososphaera sp.]